MVEQPHPNDEKQEAQGKEPPTSVPEQDQVESRNRYESPNDPDHNGKWQRVNRFLHAYDKLFQLALGFLGLLVAALTLFILNRQTSLISEQSRLASEQTKLMDRQTELIACLIRIQVVRPFHGSCGTEDNIV